MVKNFKEPSSPHINKEKKEKLLQLMDTSKISLLRASQILDIPYNTAKQILFIYSTPKKRNTIASLTPTSAKSTVSSAEKPYEGKLSPSKQSEDRYRKRHCEDKYRRHREQPRPSNCQHC